jgi:hypothetical protein
MAIVYQRLQNDAAVGDGPSIIDLTQDGRYAVPCSRNLCIMTREGRPLPLDRLRIRRGQNGSHP